MHRASHEKEKENMERKRTVLVWGNSKSKEMAVNPYLEDGRQCEISFAYDWANMNNTGANVANVFPIDRKTKDLSKEEVEKIKFRFSEKYSGVVMSSNLAEAVKKLLRDPDGPATIGIVATPVAAKNLASFLDDKLKKTKNGDFSNVEVLYTLDGLEYEKIEAKDFKPSIKGPVGIMGIYFEEEGKNLSFIGRANLAGFLKEGYERVSGERAAELNKAGVDLISYEVHAKRIVPLEEKAEFEKNNLGFRKAGPAVAADGRQGIEYSGGMEKVFIAPTPEMLASDLVLKDAKTADRKYAPLNQRTVKIAEALIRTNFTEELKTKKQHHVLELLGYPMPERKLGERTNYEGPDGKFVPEKDYKKMSPEEQQLCTKKGVSSFYGDIMSFGAREKKKENEKAPAKKTANLSAAKSALEAGTAANAPAPEGPAKEPKKDDYGLA